MYFTILSISNVTSNYSCQIHIVVLSKSWTSMVKTALHYIQKHSLT